MCFKKKSYTEKLSTTSNTYPRAPAILDDMPVPPPSPAFWARSVAVRNFGCFKYKKEQWCKCLKLLDPKRQFLVVNRHDQSVKRQIMLALLSLHCHAPVCLVTKKEYQNDA
jgi:hypothetical protein